MSEYDYDVCVVGGCGHVGLPLAILLSSRGRKVCIYDVNRESVARIAAGEMPFLENGAEELLRANIGRTLHATADPSVISLCRYLVVIIGTPVDEHLNPSARVMKRCFEELLPHFRDGQHVILRSTVFPGTTAKLARFLKKKGLQLHVSFCPERIAQGFALRELQDLPQIVSGITPEAERGAEELFRSLTEEIVVMTPMEAEVAKLFTNSWRYIQFAAANQFFMMATEYGLDFYRILEGMKYKYPRLQGLPAAGFAAGPCLFKDTMQLAAFNHNNFFLGHAAMLVNEGLPNFVVQRLMARHDLSEMSVGILGMAFKPNIDDPRESLSYKLKKILEIEARKVLCSDVYIREAGFVEPDVLFRECDIVILGVPHREYAGLAPPGRPVVDIWNFFGQGGLF